MAVSLTIGTVQENIIDYGSSISFYIHRNRLLFTLKIVKMNYLEDDDEHEHSSETKVSMEPLLKRIPDNSQNVRGITKARCGKSSLEEIPLRRIHILSKIPKHGSVVSEISSVEFGIRGLAAKGCVRERLDQVNGAGTPVQR